MPKYPEHVQEILKEKNSEIRRLKRIIRDAFEAANPGYLEHLYEEKDKASRIYYQERGGY